VTEYEAEITLNENGATVAFEDRHGKPVTFSGAREERYMVAKTLRAAAEEERRKADSVSERDLARHYERNAERLEKELTRMGV
jgi:hypothetical protein